MWHLLLINEIALLSNCVRTAFKFGMIYIYTTIKHMRTSACAGTVVICVYCATSLARRNTRQAPRGLRLCYERRGIENPVFLDVIDLHMVG
jgi:hypothetical protein